MTRTWIAGLWVVLAISACGYAEAQEADVNALISELRGQVEARSRPPQELGAAYEQVIAALLPGLGSEDPSAQREPQQTLEAIAFHASRPSADEERAALCLAMAEFIGQETAKPARVWMLRQLEKIGRAEVADEVAKHLGDPDAEVQGRALAALQANPSARAGAQIRAALERAATPEARVGLINAAGFRGDATAVDLLARLLREADADVASAAAAALGAIGNERAAEALGKVRLNGRIAPSLESAVMDAYLLSADKLALQGKTGRAVQIYSRVYASKGPQHRRLAALRGLVLHEETRKSADMLLRAMWDADPQMQMAAGRLAMEIEDVQALQRLAREMSSLPAPAQAALIGVLGERGVSGALPQVVGAAGSEDSDVRIAAVEAMGRIGDAAVVPLLAEAATKQGGEQRAAREGLARLRGAEIENAIVSALEHAEPGVRAELVRVLAARRAQRAVPAILSIAQRDADEGVRVEAINALGTLAGVDQLRALVELLVRAATDGELRAAESAIGSVIARIDDAERRAAPILAALERSTGAARLGLLRLLGRTGSAGALDVLRMSAKSEDEETQLAAVRALSDWPDERPAAELLDLARNALTQQNRVLAMRGYVRVVGLGGNRPAAERARMLEEALGVARMEEKRQIIAALGDVQAVEALRLVEPYLDEPLLRNEAIAAVLKIARVIARGGGEEPFAAARKILEISNDEGIRRQAEQILRMERAATGTR